jgi:hypothetical protein
MSVMAMLRQLLSLLTPRRIIRGCLGYLEALVRGLIANTVKALRHAFELRLIQTVFVFSSQLADQPLLFLSELTQFIDSSCSMTVKEVGVESPDLVNHIFARVRQLKQRLQQCAVSAPVKICHIVQ